MPTASQAMMIKRIQTKSQQTFLYPEEPPAPWTCNDMKGRAMYKSRETPNSYIEKAEPAKKHEGGDGYQTLQKLTVNGYTGTLAYDTKKRSYRLNVNSAGTCRQSKPAETQQCGDGISVGKLPNVKYDKNPPPQDMSDATLESASFVSEIPSDVEFKQHFTSPSPSLLDATPQATFVNNPPVRPLQPFPCLVLPQCGHGGGGERPGKPNQKRYEELVLRGRFAYTSNGSLVRVNDYKAPGDGMKIQIPFSSGHPKRRKPVPKLTISTLDPMKISGDFKVPYKPQGFQVSPPKACVNSFRKRSPRKKKKRELIDVVKETVHWDQRVIPGVYCRQQAVPPMPTAVCFSLKDSSSLSHADVKALLEQQICCRVKCVQYDPMTVKSGDPEILDRWIITLATRSEREHMMKVGLTIEDDHVTVRSWDDVVKQELESYRNSMIYPCGFRLPRQHNIALQSFLKAN